MNKRKFLDQLLIKPKKFIQTEGIHQKNPDAQIVTNVEGIDISYLLELSGYNSCLKAVELDEFENLCVLCIGDASPEVSEYIFENEEKYYMSIKKESIVIVAETTKGMLLGLKSLIRMYNETDCILQGEIEDYPDIPFRAVHACMFRPDDGTEKEESSPEYIKRMMKTAAICGYNHIFIEFWGMFPYTREYAHWPNAYTKAEIEDLVSFAIDKLHITPLPAQNLTTHAGWSRIVSRKHTVLDQRPDLAHMYIPGGWCFATENPDTKEFLKSIIYDLLEVFRNPPYLHACCDKAFGFGSTEEDRTMSADLLFAKHISFLNSYLQTKNTRMVMWGDMLYSSMDALYWKCSETTVNYLPKNILINIWTHNNPGLNWQDAAFFENKDMETVYSPFINEESIESMVTVCRNRKSFGMVQTTWHKPQTAVPYVILSGALQWCGVKPSKADIDKFADRWYK